MLTPLPSYTRRAAVQLIIGVVLLSLGRIAARADPSEPVVPNVNAPVSRGQPAYCGVCALHRTLAALGMRVRFDDLLKPEYVGTRKGSSIDELTRAAVACGLNCETANGMTCGILRRLQSPTVLHVRGAFESSDYDHWILFMGIEDGKARIYDGSHAAELIDLGDLTARWDGTGLILSDSPIDCSVLYLESAAYFCFIAAPALFVVGTGRYVQRRWAARDLAATLVENSNVPQTNGVPHAENNSSPTCLARLVGKAGGIPPPPPEEPVCLLRSFRGR